jgi:4-amino-4-deoxy-L-arabinose transferase-like glycosyltransferase
LLKRFELLQMWLALTGLTVLTRLPALFYPRAIDDEAVYSVVANVMLAGGLPYRDAIERKPPLLFVVYWAVFRLFGACNWLALHVVAVVWALLTMAGLFVLAKRIAGSRAGMLAALAYALIQPWATAKNLAFNGEVLMNLPLVWAYAIVLPRMREFGRGSYFSSLGAGLLLAAAFLLKQPAAIAAVPLGVYLLAAPLWCKGVLWRQSIGQAAALTGAFAAVLGGAMVVLWRYGLLGEAWYWTMADHSVPHVFWQHGLEHSALFLLVALPLVLPLAAWQPLRQAWRGTDAELWAVLGWLVVSVIGAAAGGRFYPHYYIQIIPPLAVLAAVTYAQIDGLTGVARRRWISPRFAAIWLTVAAVVSLGVETGQLLADRVPSAAARYVAAQAHPTDRLFVWGQQTPLYLDAGMLPASRYIATYPLTGYIFGGPLPGVSTRDRIVPGAWANFGADFRRHPPAFIIDTQVRSGDAYPIRDFPVLAQLIARDYQRVAVFSNETVYHRRDMTLTEGANLTRMDFP